MIAWVPRAHKGFGTHPSEHKGSRGYVSGHEKWSRILISNPSLTPELQALYLHEYPVNISIYISVFLNNTSNSEFDFSVCNPHHHRHHQTKQKTPAPPLVFPIRLMAYYQLLRCLSQTPHPNHQQVLWAQPLRYFPDLAASHTRIAVLAPSIRIRPGLSNHRAFCDSLNAPLERLESQGRSSVPHASIQLPGQPWCSQSTRRSTLL